MSRPRAANSTDNELGRAMAQLRGRRSQAEVADRAGFDAETWSLYETGRRRPRDSRLSQIAFGLGCSQLELEELAWQLRRARLQALRPDPPATSAAQEQDPPSDEVGVLLEQTIPLIESFLRLLLRTRAS